VSAVAIYEGTARHRRPAPNAHEFTPRLFLAYLDVDALPASLDRLPGWSARRPAPVHFRREDFFDRSTAPLGDAVRDLVHTRLGRRPDGPVYLLAHLRTFGWSFNPVAVYYCWRADAPELDAPELDAPELDAPELDALVLEVTNTPWGERHWYVFDARNGVTTQTTPKEMHVSPFLPMDVDYRVSWTAPGERADLDVVVQRGGTTVFAAGLRLHRTVLDRRTAITILLRYPVLTLRVSMTIYRRALGLFVRRLPLYRHPARSVQEVGA
jgi:DUF1365 family protein